MSAIHILSVLSILEEALDSNNSDISIETMGRIDFLIGHPELTNPFRYAPSSEAWDRGWHREAEKWMKESKNAPDDFKLYGRTRDPAGEEDHEDPDSD